jgi:uncharacterized protein
MTTAKMNRTSGLSETEMLRQLIDEAASILTEEGAREVYLFGSAASGSVREDSDIDLAVAGLPPERFFEAMGKVADLLQRPLDLVDLDEETPFTRYLRDEGELLRVR